MRGRPASDRYRISWDGGWRKCCSETRGMMEVGCARWVGERPVALGAVSFLHHGCETCRLQCIGFTCGKFNKGSQSSAALAVFRKDIRCLQIQRGSHAVAIAFEPVSCPLSGRCEIELDITATLLGKKYLETRRVPKTVSPVRHCTGWKSQCSDGADHNIFELVCISTEARDFAANCKIRCWSIRMWNKRPLCQNSPQPDFSMLGATRYDLHLNPAPPAR